MAENEEWTCGKGLAESAVMPELMAKVLDATVGVLENHTRSLSAGDANGKQEIEAYERVVQGHRRAIAELRTLAETMRSCRGLPVAEHDMASLADAASADTLGALVQAQQGLLQSLSERATEYSAMLDEMRNA